MEPTLDISLSNTTISESNLLRARFRQTNTSAAFNRAVVSAAAVAAAVATAVAVVVAVVIAVAVEVCKVVGEFCSFVAEVGSQ